MRQALRVIAFLLTEVLNGIAVIGLIYVVTQDVTAMDVVRWLS